MATRRKYKTPQGYFTGGAVPHSPDAESEPALPTTEVPAAGPADPSPHNRHSNPPKLGELELAVDDNPLLRALKAQQRAEQLQSDPIERAISGMLVPDPAKEWLRSHREYLSDPAKNSQLGEAHQRAMHVVQGDAARVGSAEYLSALEAALGSIDHVRELTSAAARPTPENHQAREAVQDLQREAKTIAAEIVPPQPTPAPRRSMPVSAPVSREAPTPSGQRFSESQITLSPAEREAALYTYPDLSQHEAEREYAIGKRRYQAAKRAGYHPDGGQ